MIQIRRNVFETNSSSCHSVSLSKDVETDNNLIVIDDAVHCCADEFGWYPEDFTDAQTKLNYLITMAATTTVGTSWCDIASDEEYVEDFIKTSEFEEIQNCVCKITGCNRLVVDSLYGYIDHESVFVSMSNFLAYNNLTIEEYIFGNTILHIDNDNHQGD